MMLVFGKGVREMLLAARALIDHIFLPRAICQAKIGARHGQSEAEE